MYTAALLGLGATFAVLAGHSFIYALAKTFGMDLTYQPHRWNP